MSAGKLIPAGRRSRLFMFSNLITLGSFFCGFYSIYLAIQNRPLYAAYMIFIAMILDFLDGKIARLTKTVSKFGSQADSLTDLISCGIAPAILVCTLFIQEYGKAGWLFPFLYAVCAMVRLARYNAQAKGEKSKFFSGLPVPAACGLVTSFVLLYLKLTHPFLLYFTPLVMAIAAFLMVSSIKYPVFLRGNLERKFFVVFIIVGIVFSRRLHYAPHLMLFGYFTGYVIKGMFCEIKRRNAAKNDKVLQSNI